MVNFCCVPICKNESYPGSRFSFHKFPSDPDILQKWVDAIGRKNWTPPKRSVICSAHFSSSSFKTERPHRLLLKNAIPTENLDCIIRSAVHLKPDTTKNVSTPIKPPILIKTESEKSSQKCDSSTDEFEIPINSAVEVRADPLSDVNYIKEEDDPDIDVSPCVIQQRIDVTIKEEPEINQGNTLQNEDFLSEITEELTERPDSTELLKFEFNNDVDKELRRRILRERKLIKMIKSLKNQNLRLKKQLAEFRKAEKASQI